MWTRFYDLHSGGDAKTDYATIYIQGDEAEAVATFKRHFDRNPFNVTCDCCGADFSVSTYDTLAEASEFDTDPSMIIT
jgi:hypothetical protein